MTICIEGIYPTALRPFLESTAAIQVLPAEWSLAALILAREDIDVSAPATLLCVDEVFTLPLALLILLPA